MGVLGLGWVFGGGEPGAEVEHLAPVLEPFPLGRTYWQDRERTRTAGRSTYVNDEGSRG